MPTETSPTTQLTARPRRVAKLKFSLPEMLLILATDEEKGSPLPVRGLPGCVLAGALLSELALRGKFALEEGRLALVAAKPTGNEILDAALEAIAAEAKGRKLGRWIRLLGDESAVQRVARRLEGRGVLGIDEQGLLRLLPYGVHPYPQASAKYWLKRRLRAVALAGGKPVAADTALLNLLAACGLLKLVFTRDERKSAQKALASLAPDEIFGVDTALLLAEIQSAAANPVK